MFSQKGQSKVAVQNVSPIIGIQFSIMSPDEIRKSSVAHITDRNTYDNNRPVVGGPFDARMGVLEPGLICPTDGLDYMQTPGYFGHIELAPPPSPVPAPPVIQACGRQSRAPQTGARTVQPRRK